MLRARRSVTIATGAAVARRRGAAVAVGRRHRRGEGARALVDVAHVVARRRATDLVGKMAVAIHAAVGGEIADEADFLLAPEDL